MNMLTLFVRILICLIIVGAGILITIKLSRRAYKSRQESDPEHSYYHDEDGNHSYYERSIIEKKEFARRNPSVSPQILRTFRRLFSN